jgi:hypothetical protein
MSAADVIQKRRRATLAFDPASEPGTNLLAWWSIRNAAVDGSNNVVSVPSSGGSTGFSLTRPGSSIGPAYVANDSIMGNKPAALLAYNSAVDRRLASPSFSSTALWTVVAIGNQDGTSVSGRTQYLWTQQGRQLFATYSGARGDDCLCNNGTQTVLGAVVRGTGAFCTILTGGGGASNYFALNSSRPIVANMGSLALSGAINIGGIQSGALANGWNGRWSEILVYNGLLSTAVVRRIMLWAQSLYRMSVSFDVPGTIFRAREYFFTGGGPTSADGFFFPMYSPVESMVAESGALRAFMTYDSNAEDVQRGVVQSSVSQGSSWWSGRSSDGRHQIKTAGGDWRSLIGHGGPGSTANPLRNEIFTVMGGGQTPQVFWRDDQTLPFVELPYEVGATVPAFAPTGKVDVGGNRTTNPSTPIQGYITEFATLRDGALPTDVKQPTYVAGAMIFYGGNNVSAIYSAHWPARMIQRNLAAGRYSYPRPRQVDFGLGLPSWTNIGTRFATDVAPFLVAGATRIVLDAGYYDQNNEAKTPAQAYAAAVATFSAIKSTYASYAPQLVICTTTPTSFLTEANRTAFNALVTGATSPPWDFVLDFGAITPWVNVDGQSKPDGATGILMGSVAGTTLASWFST